MSGEPPRSRHRPNGAIVGVTSLLFLQGIGLVLLGLLPTLATRFGLSIGPIADLSIVREANDVLRLLIVLQGLLAISSGLGLLRVQPAAWVIAMSVQGIQLLVALILYFTHKPGYVYPIMAYGVLMVLYLRYSPVADAFMEQRPQVQERRTP